MTKTQVPAAEEYLILSHVHSTVFRLCDAICLATVRHVGNTLGAINGDLSTTIRMPLTAKSFGSIEAPLGSSVRRGTAFLKKNII